MKRMRVVTVILVALAVVMVGASAVLHAEAAPSTVYIWDGDNGTLWSNEVNWHLDDGFPSTGGDDAVFELLGGLETVNLITEGIRHMTVDGSDATNSINLVFNSNSTHGNTLTCGGDFVFIAPSNHLLSVLISDSAKITHH